MKIGGKFFSSLYISLLCVSVSSNVLATQAAKSERWFEIEVILFKQLGNKEVLKEQFPEGVSSKNLPQYAEHFDLLSSYLQPDITGIKQSMPVCNDKNSPDDIFASLPKFSLPISAALKEIEHVDGSSLPKFINEENRTAPVITPVLDLQNKLNSPLLSTQNICIISRKDFENLLSDEQFANLELDGIDIEAMPSKLKALGMHVSDSPYLIANESLLLADISQRLQWSKEFKPLLHFGWRQIGVTRNKAIPLKLFAGQHLDYQYQQALNNYQSALDDVQLAEQLSTQQDLNSEIEQNTSSIAEVNQQKLTQLLSEFDKVESTPSEQLIDELSLQTLDMLIENNETNIVQNTILKTNKQPIEPLQPWFLDGFFKIHLDHYLYITADFNILSQALEENKSNTVNATSNKPNVKLINFSQNKRAITGEIHYFDHPYIGMIVQIRRFDPSKPKDEAVTQVIN